MGPPQRVRYNAKARQSTAGGHTKKRKRLEDMEGSNVEMIVPEEAKEAKARRDALYREMRENMAEGNVPSKKRKRMEKYIDKKLQQEERQHLLYKLVDTQGTSNAVNLQSSSKLGTGRTETHQETRDKEEHIEVKRLMRKGRKRGRAIVPLDDESDGSGEDDFLEEAPQAGPSKLPSSKQANPPIAPESSPKAPLPDASATIQTTILGSALARDASGNTIAPRIIKRKKSKAKRWNVPKQKLSHAAGESDDDRDDDASLSFDSSDSDLDEVEDSNGEENEWGGIANGDGEEAGTEESGEGSENEGEDSSNSEEMEDAEEDMSDSTKPRFKDWAKRQVEIARGFADMEEHPSTNTSQPEPHSSHPNPAQPSKIQSLAPSSHTLPSILSGPLGSTLQTTQSSFAQTILPLLSHPSLKPLPPVIRKASINEARLSLPIMDEEQQLMETILLNNVVVLQGETGSGKTSQVVQFLWEGGFGREERAREGQPDDEGPVVGGGDSSAGNGKNWKKKVGRKGVGFGGMIGITQPRRVAAISMSARVSEELTPPHPAHSKLPTPKLPPSPVAHQIRYSASLTPHTRIKFMTEGILLRELSGDFLLRKYSILVLDEAHERSLGVDVLLGCLTRVVGLREKLWREDEVVDGWRVQPLRLIIMSATLSLTSLLDNTRLFPTPPPVISIPARQHPLTVHFSRRTNPDYVKEVLKKVLKIHRRLPEGGVLVFLTGQREIEYVVSKLSAIGKGKKAHDSKDNSKKRTRGNDRQESLSAKQADVEIDDIDFGVEQSLDPAGTEKIDERTDAATDYDPEDLDSEDDELDKELGIEVEDTENEAPLHVVPLFSLLPPERQMQVFQPPPPGTRLVVVATNVAETSLTIPGIRYVVDCGRAKERQYDPLSGIQSFPVTWISKASAQQRAGRAGRTGPGHVYRLYSSAVFENFFPQDSEPEILRMPIEGVVLTMKSMGIDSVVNFPFPSQPDRQRLAQAEKVLVHLGALKEVAKGPALINELGKTMNLFPLAPRYAKMLVVGRQHGCLPYIIAIVSALSVGDPFLSEDSLFGQKDDREEAHNDADDTPKGEQRRQARKAYFTSKERHSLLGNHSSDMLKYLSVVGAYEFAGGGHAFCDEHFVRPKSMEEIHKLRAQIHDIVKGSLPNESCDFKPNLQPPTDAQMKAIRQMITAGFIDQVAIRADLHDRPDLRGTKFATCKNVAYRAMGIGEPVFIHPTSVLFPNPPPTFVCFQDVVRTSKPWMKNLTIVNPSWLYVLGPTLCTFSTKKQTTGSKLITSTSVVSIPHFGPEGWELPPMKSRA